MDKLIAKYSTDELGLLLHAEACKVKSQGTNLTYEGLIPRIRKFSDRVIVFATCTACNGTRLNDTARSVTIDGVNIGEVSSLQADAALTWVNQLELPGAEPLLATLRQLLQGFEDIGLGYSGLDRPSGTLSGGEAQRVRMIRQLGSPVPGAAPWFMKVASTAFACPEPSQATAWTTTA